MEDLWKMFKILLILLLFTVISAYTIGYIFSEQTGNVAHIRIRGPIISEEGIFITGVSSQKVINRINSASRDPRIEAILFEINSPGGTVIASREISNAIERTNLTTVCWLRDSATSGAYWAASACDKIVADEFTLTGGIGVTGSYLEFSGLFEKYGINYVRLVSDEHKDMGTPYREPTEQEMEAFQDILDEIHIAFVESVAENRNLSTDYVNEISKGSIIMGNEAYEIGLVDVLGSKNEAIEIIKNQTNLTEIKLLEYRDELTFLDLMSMSVSQQFIEYLMNQEVSIKAN